MLPNISIEEIERAAGHPDAVPRQYIKQFISGANWMQEKLANQYRTELEKSKHDFDVMVKCDMRNEEIIENLNSKLKNQPELLQCYEELASLFDKALKTAQFNEVGDGKYDETDIKRVEDLKARIKKLKQT